MSWREKMEPHARACRGEEGMRISDLSRANLSEADLSGANFSRADLSRANFSGANFSRADLSGANFSRADLSRANFSWANLSRTERLLSVGAIGSRKDAIVFDKETGKIHCGCWYGTLAEFEVRVASVYPDGQFRVEYDAAIAFFKAVTK